MHKNNLNNAVC